MVWEMDGFDFVKSFSKRFWNFNAVLAEGDFQYNKLALTSYK